MEETKQYIKIRKDFVSDIEASDLSGKYSRESSEKALVFVESDKRFPVGSLISFRINPPEKEGTYRAIGIVEQTTDGGDESAAIGLAVKVLEIERAETAQGDTDQPPVDRETEGNEGSADEHSSTIPLPTKEKIVEVMESLLGTSIDITEEAAEPAVESSFIATFVTDDGNVAALCLCDIDLVGKIGAMLELVPPEDAAQQIEKGELSENILGNFKEAMNVSASLFNQQDAPHVSAGDIVTGKDKLPTPTKKILASHTSTACFKLTIPNYGDGVMCIYTR